MWRTSENSVPANFGPWPRLRGLKAPCAVLVQHDAEREAIHAFAVLHRCQRIRAVLQTRPRGSLRSGQFYPLGTAFCERGAKLQSQRFCVFRLVSWRPASTLSVLRGYSNARASLKVIWPIGCYSGPASEHATKPGANPTRASRLRLLADLAPRPRVPRSFAGPGSSECVSGLEPAPPMLGMPPTPRMLRTLDKLLSSGDATLLSHDGVRAGG
jgi:hypothetical protein